MANTYTQIHIHVVFSVRNRRELLTQTIRRDVLKYITGIVQNKEHKMVAINAVSDHIHLLIGLRPGQSLSSLVQEIKCCSTKWINDSGFLNEKFFWQEGFSAFACSRSVVPKVIRYILNQEKHHRYTTFSEEYIRFLKDAGIDFDPKYLF